MENKQRPYNSDAETWNVFVGSITPQEFLDPYIGSDDPINAAIHSLMSSWGWYEEPPSWLEASLTRYILANTGES